MQVLIRIRCCNCSWKSNLKIRDTIRCLFHSKVMYQSPTLKMTVFSFLGWRLCLAEQVLWKSGQNFSTREMASAIQKCWLELEMEVLGHGYRVCASIVDCKCYCAWLWKRQVCLERWNNALYSTPVLLNCVQWWGWCGWCWSFADVRRREWWVQLATALLWSSFWSFDWQKCQRELGLHVTYWHELP